MRNATQTREMLVGHILAICGDILYTSTKGKESMYIAKIRKTMLLIESLDKAGEACEKQFFTNEQS